MIKDYKLVVIYDDNFKWFFGMNKDVFKLILD